MILFRCLSFRAVKPVLTAGNWINPVFREHDNFQGLWLPSIWNGKRWLRKQGLQEMTMHDKKHELGCKYRIKY